MVLYLTDPPNVYAMKEIIIILDLCVYSKYVHRFVNEIFVCCCVYR